VPVRGWLLALCILLAFWNPATLAVVAASHVASVTPPPALTLVLLGVRLVVTGIGVAAGMALWHRRIGAVKLAKASLVLSALEVVCRLATRDGLSAAPPGTRLPLAIALILFNGDF
jgi:hypothetical protein